MSSIQWSQDGRWIYYLAPDDKTKEEKARDEVKDNVFRFEEDRKDRHLWRVAVKSGERERITEGEFSLRGYRISRDGSRIVLQRAPTPLLDDLLRSEVWVMNADGSEARQLTSNTVGEAGAELSPDNSRVLFVANTDDAMSGFYYNQRMFVIPASGGEAESVVPGGTYDINRATWSADGRSVYFEANTGLRQDLYQVSLDSREVVALTEGDHAVRSWDFEPRANLHAFSVNDPTNPGDLWVRPAAAGAGATRAGPAGDARQVTHVLDYLGQRFRLPRVEAVQWPGEDGVRVEGLLYYPLDYRPGTRYPLVVQTHGGPASSDKFSFPRSHNYESVLAARGYMVFKPNYRGSTGYGDAFLRDMVGHYFHQAHKDVMTGVDALMARGLVDGDRMAKMGWSAGGHMTNKIITYTDRFKAASTGAGAVDWISMYAQSDVRIYRTPWFGGSPWGEEAPIKQYLADSPLFEVYKVRTPTIILVGEDDPRVPMPQSVELYRALKHNGVPTHLYVAPKQGHGWRELQQRLFKANVELDWFERWVRDRKYEWETSPVDSKRSREEAPAAEKEMS
ncbi:MAG: S9 family peptidase [Gemmatimonadota bacterium]